MRADLDIIQEWIAPGSRVLDLGCGDGELLAWLREHKQVSGYGLEIDPDNIAHCIERGVNVIQQDLDQGLGNGAFAEHRDLAIGIDPFEPGLMQPSSVDVRVDRFFRVFRNSRYPYIDVKTEQEELTEPDLEQLQMIFIMSAVQLLP